MKKHCAWWTCTLFHTINQFYCKPTITNSVAIYRWKGDTLVPVAVWQRVKNWLSKLFKNDVISKYQVSYNWTNQCMILDALVVTVNDCLTWWILYEVKNKKEAFIADFLLSVPMSYKACYFAWRKPLSNGRRGICTLAIIPQA